MTIANPKVLVREPPEYPRIEEFHRTEQMTNVTLRVHVLNGFRDRHVAVPSHLPDVVTADGRSYVKGNRADGKWREANIWPIV